MVKSVADIYELKLEQLLELERMGKKSAEKMLRNIDASRKQPLPRVLNGLGIPFVGERTAQILADQFGSLDAIADADEESCSRPRKWGPKSRRASGSSSTSGAIANWSSGCAALG